MFLDFTNWEFSFLKLLAHWDFRRIRLFVFACRPIAQHSNMWVVLLSRCIIAPLLLFLFVFLFLRLFFSVSALIFLAFFSFSRCSSRGRFLLFLFIGSIETEIIAFDLLSLRLFLLLFFLLLLLAGILRGGRIFGSLLNRDLLLLVLCSFFVNVCLHIVFYSTQLL